jgi:hypothetical protein
MGERGRYTIGGGTFEKEGEKKRAILAGKKKVSVSSLLPKFVVRRKTTRTITIIIRKKSIYINPRIINALLIKREKKTASSLFLSDKFYDENHSTITTWKVNNNIGNRRVM